MAEQVQLKLIKRTADYYQNKEQSNNYASASFIRNLIQNNLQYRKYLPYDYQIISLREAENKLLSIINYQTILNSYKNNYSIINNNDEGIINYIINNGDFTGNY